MTFHWIGNVGHVSDEDITAIVADMRAKGLKLTWQGVVEHLGRIDPDGTLNISATELWERARVLRL